MEKVAVKWLPVPVRGAAVLITHLQNGEQPTMTVLENEIGVRQAAELLGVSKRRVQAMCDEGVLSEGRDWRKKPSLGPNGTYLIRFDAVMRLRGSER